MFRRLYLLVITAAGPAPPGSPASSHGNSLGHRLPLRPEPLGVNTGVAVKLNVGHVGLAADLGWLVGATGLGKEDGAITVQDCHPVVLAGDLALVRSQ